MTIETELPAVKIKPLEWSDKSGEDGYEIKWYGTSPAGMTYVAKAVRHGDMILCNGKYHRFLEDAKFLAQADYERRILSALVPSNPAESRCEELVKALKDRDEEIARYQGLLDAAIDDYNNARNTALGEAAKVAYDYECSLADYGDSVDAKHFYEGGVGDASIGISKAIRSLIQERKASDDLKEAEGVVE